MFSSHGFLLLLLLSFLFLLPFDLALGVDFRVVGFNETGCITTHTIAEDAIGYPFNFAHLTVSADAVTSNLSPSPFGLQTLTRDLNFQRFTPNNRGEGVISNILTGELYILYSSGSQFGYSPTIDSTHPVTHLQPLDPNTGTPSGPLIELSLSIQLDGVSNLLLSGYNEAMIVFSDFSLRLAHITFPSGNVIYIPLSPTVISPPFQVLNGIFGYGILEKMAGTSYAVTLMPNSHFVWRTDVITGVRSLLGNLSITDNTFLMLSASLNPPPGRLYWTSNEIVDPPIKLAAGYCDVTYYQNGITGEFYIVGNVLESQCELSSARDIYNYVLESPIIFPSFMKLVLIGKHNRMVLTEHGLAPQGPPLFLPIAAPFKDYSDDTLYCLGTFFGVCITTLPATAMYLVPLNPTNGRARSAGLLLTPQALHFAALSSNIIASGYGEGLIYSDGLSFRITFSTGHVDPVPGVLNPSAASAIFLSCPSTPFVSGVLSSPDGINKAVLVPSNGDRIVSWDLISGIVSDFSVFTSNSLPGVCGFQIDEVGGSHVWHFQYRSSASSVLPSGGLVQIAACPLSGIFSGFTYVTSLLLDASCGTADTSLVTGDYIGFPLFASSTDIFTYGVSGLGRYNLVTLDPITKDMTSLDFIITDFETGFSYTFYTAAGTPITQNSPGTAESLVRFDPLNRLFISSIPMAPVQLLGGCGNLILLSGRGEFGIISNAVALGSPRAFILEFSSGNLLQTINLVGGMPTATCCDNTYSDGILTKTLGRRTALIPYYEQTSSSSIIQEYDFTFGDSVSFKSFMTGAFGPICGISLQLNSSRWYFTFQVAPSSYPRNFFWAGGRDTRVLGYCTFTWTDSPLSPIPSLSSASHSVHISHSPTHSPTHTSTPSPSPHVVGLDCEGGDVPCPDMTCEDSFDQCEGVPNDLEGIDEQDYTFTGDNSTVILTITSTNQTVFVGYIVFPKGTIPSGWTVAIRDAKDDEDKLLDDCQKEKKQETTSQPFSVTVFDERGHERSIKGLNQKIQLQIWAKLNENHLNEACLGFTDPSVDNWECLDGFTDKESTKNGDAFFISSGTDHLTSFAVLLQSDPCVSKLWYIIAVGASLGLALLLGILLILLAYTSNPFQEFLLGEEGQRIQELRVLEKMKQ